MAHRGSALISALFIMTMVAIAATAMSTRLQLDIHRTRLTISSDRLYLASQGVIFWAMDFLSNQQPIRYTASEAPTLIANTLKYPGVSITGDLLDLQARFNLNNLQEKKQLITFDNLIKNTIPNLNSEDRKALVLATENWVMPFQPDRGFDAFLTEYINKNPAYWPSHQSMQSVSEFRLINSVDAKIYQKLYPFITALPEITSININTAPKEVLGTLGNGLATAQIEELLQARGNKAIKDLKEITPLLQKLNIPTASITTESHYFLCRAVVSSEDLTLINYTVLKRQKDKKGNISVEIVVESLNTL